MVYARGSHVMQILHNHQPVSLCPFRKAFLLDNLILWTYSVECLHVLESRIVSIATSNVQIVFAILPLHLRVEEGQEVTYIAETCGWSYVHAHCRRYSTTKMHDQMVHRFHVVNLICLNLMEKQQQECSYSQQRVCIATFLCSWMLEPTVTLTICTWK